MNAAARLAYVFAHYQATRPGVGCHCAWMDIRQALLEPNCPWFVDLSAHTQWSSEHTKLFHSKDLN